MRQYHYPETDGAKYGTVEQKIKAIVETIPDVNYLFKNWAQANEEMDHIDGPTVIYVLPPSGDFYVHNSTIKDYPQAQIAFVASTEFDFESDENDNIIEQMKRVCAKFIKKVNESGMFEQIDGKLPYKVLYDHFDENVTGIVITPPLKEEEGIYLCDEEFRNEDEEATEYLDD